MSSEQFYKDMIAIAKAARKDEFDHIVSRPPTQEAADLIEETTGIKIPDNLLAFSLQYNGLSIFAKEELWPEPELLDVRQAWEFQSGVIILGIEAEQLPEWASIMSIYDQFVERFGIRDILPLLSVYGRKGHFWGARKDGSFVEVNGDEVTIVNRSVVEVYSEQIHELIERMHKWMAPKNKQ